MKTNLTRFAYQQIRQAIVNDQFDLGEPLSEIELAKALGVSKAPVRAALLELKQQGLVDIIAKSGSYVFSPSGVEIGELCELRFILEERALRLSMARDHDAFMEQLNSLAEQMVLANQQKKWADNKGLDTRFHLCFFTHANNRYLARAYENASHQLEALRNRFMNAPVFRNRAFDEHLKLVELLQAGKVGRAVDLLSAHIARTQKLQSTVDWTMGRAQRKDYAFRRYEDIFTPIA